MKVVITDVTRMGGTRVCVAGLARSGPIRLNDPSPTEAVLDGLDGLQPSDIIDVTWTAAETVVRPHVEDGQWNENTLSKIGSESHHDFCQRLARSAYSSVRQAFGKPYIKGSGGNVAFRPGRGDRSLATIKASEVHVYSEFDRKVRVDFSDASDTYTMVALDDLCITQHKNRCRSCQNRLDHHLGREFSGGSALVRVGLGRKFATPSHPEACWLQVNGIYRPGAEPKHFI